MISYYKGTKSGWKDFCREYNLSVTEAILFILL